MENTVNNQFLLPLLSLLIALFAVFVGPFISIYLNKIQLKNNLSITNKQVIAPMRQAWISRLRDLLSELLGKTAHYWAAGFEDRS